MRPLQNNPKRSRGRGGRKPHIGGGSSGGGGSSSGGGGGVNPNRILDSNGPDIKIRGTAYHIHEKYQNLARDAHTSGDYVAAENYSQHAEHYFRLLAANAQAMGGRDGQPRNGAVNGTRPLGNGQGDQPEEMTAGRGDEGGGASANNAGDEAGYNEDAPLTG